MSDFDHVSETPDGWERTTLGAIRKDYSGSVNPEKHQDTKFEHYSVPCFDEGKPVVEKGKEIGSTKKVVEEDMVLLCKINPRINRAWRVGNYSSHPKIGSTEWIRFPPVEGIDPDYLRYYMSQPGFRNYLHLNASGAGGSLMRANKSTVDKHPFLYPSLPEQRRIVAKIEELFSNLDAGMDDLQTAGQQLGRYRLSILQAAVEGRLTADWRRTHDPEPADQLLERILEDRREKWEERYKWERYESKGKEPPSGWKDRYTEPDPPDDTDLRELPKGWTWSKLGHAFFVHLGATPRRSREDFWGGDIAWASSSEINQREITYTEETITEAGLEDTSTQVLPPGTLMLGMIGQGRTRGMVAELKIPAATSQNSAAIEVAHCSVPPKWVYYYLEAQYHELRRMGSGNNQKALNKGIVQEIPIPLPPLAEQKQIVDEVERLLSVADDAAATAEREQTRAERLRQSILKQAFSGRLVPHDEDATPPSIDGAATVPSDSDTSDNADSDVEDLLGSADPSKQIEMDL